MWSSIGTFGATAALFVFAGLSQATIIPALESGPSPNGIEGFSFDYRADVGSSDLMRFDCVMVLGLSCPGIDGFFTIYELPGFESATAPPNWGFSLQFVGKHRRPSPVAPL